jgi:hypothetical protein
MSRGAAMQLIEQAHAGHCRKEKKRIAVLVLFSCWYVEIEKESWVEDLGHRSQHPCVSVEEKTA